MATEGSKITCSNCGRATLDARFCNWCGASQTASRDSGLGAIRNITSGVVALLALSVVSICGLAAPILASIAVLVAIAPSTEINPGPGPFGASAYAVASILVFALGVVLTRRFGVWLTPDPSGSPRLPSAHSPRDDIVPGFGKPGGNKGRARRGVS